MQMFALKYHVQHTVRNLKHVFSKVPQKNRVPAHLPPSAHPCITKIRLNQSENTFFQLHSNLESFISRVGGGAVVGGRAVSIFYDEFDYPYLPLFDFKISFACKHLRRALNKHFSRFFSNKFIFISKYRVPNNIPTKGSIKKANYAPCRCLH